MGLFSKLFEARDKPEAGTSASSYSFLFGSTKSGKPVNETYSNADDCSVLLREDTG